jgi:hypothetical protein
VVPIFLPRIDNVWSVRGVMSATSGSPTVTSVNTSSIRTSSVLPTATVTDTLRRALEMVRSRCACTSTGTSGASMVMAASAVAKSVAEGRRPVCRACPAPRCAVVVLS